MTKAKNGKSHKCPAAAFLILPTLKVLLRVTSQEPLDVEEHDSEVRHVVRETPGIPRVSLLLTHQVRDGVLTPPATPSGEAATAALSATEGPPREVSAARMSASNHAGSSSDPGALGKSTQTLGASNQRRAGCWQDFHPSGPGLGPSPKVPLEMSCIWLSRFVCRL